MIDTRKHADRRPVSARRAGVTPRTRRCATVSSGRPIESRLTGDQSITDISQAVGSGRGREMAGLRYRIALKRGRNRSRRCVETTETRGYRCTYVTSQWKPQIVCYFCRLRRFHSRLSCVRSTIFTVINDDGS